MRQLSGKNELAGTRGRRFGNRVNARHWNRGARASKIGDLALRDLVASFINTEPLRSTASRKSRTRPDFGRQSIEKMLLRNAMRSKSLSAQTEITFLQGCLNASNGSAMRVSAKGQQCVARVR